VIASVNGQSEIARVITVSGAGTVVVPEDAAALANEIRALRSNPDKRQAMSTAGTAYAREHWDGARILSYIEAELLRVAGKPTDQSTTLKVRPRRSADPTT
jgi:glycosyltransferase involved in cell wall biosynthesis